MKKKIAIITCSVMLSLPMTFFAKSNYEPVDPETVTHEDLKSAYNDLVERYDVLYDLYIESFVEEKSSGFWGKYAANSGEETKQGESEYGIWKVKYFVDKFQQPTDEAYISTTDAISGTFSNSATTNSSISVYPLITNTSISFKIYEYDRNLLTSYTHRDFDMSMKDGSGQEFSGTGTIAEGGDRIYATVDIKNELYNALRRGGKVTVRLDDTFYKTTNYLFTINADKFDAIYDSTFE